MFKAVSIASVFAVVATAQQYAPPQYAPPQYAPSQYGYNGYAPSRSKFQEPFPLIDPNYYRSIISGYSTCKSQKCNNLNKEYSTGIKESIATAGAYTSCVTACVAAEILKTYTDFKNSLAVAYDIGSARLVLSRKQLAGTGEYDVLGNRTRIGDSCCLPPDYFVKMEQIMVNIAGAAVQVKDENTGAIKKIKKII
jgi:hypothetical protein